MYLLYASKEVLILRINFCHCQHRRFSEPFHYPNKDYYYFEYRCGLLLGRPLLSVSDQGRLFQQVI